MIAIFTDGAVSLEYPTFNRLMRGNIHRWLNLYKIVEDQSEIPGVLHELGLPYTCVCEECKCVEKPLLS